MACPDYQGTTAATQVTYPDPTSTEPSSVSISISYVLPFTHYIKRGKVKAFRSLLHTFIFFLSFPPPLPPITFPTRPTESYSNSFYPDLPGQSATRQRERRLPSRQTRVGASEDVERWREMEVGVWGQSNKRRTNLQEGEHGTSRTGDGAFDFLRRERNVVNGADVAYRLLVNTRI